MKKDLLTASVLDPTLTEQVGQQSSQGVEGTLAVNGRRWRLIVNGTKLRARFDDFTARVGGVAVALDGNVPRRVPEQSANVLALWDVTPAWQVRGVVRYVGDRFADNTNAPATRVPAYTVVDLGLRWQATRRVSLDVRLDNALDEVYADNGWTTMWLLGRPRSVSLSTNVLFQASGRRGPRQSTTASAIRPASSRVP